MVGWCYNWQCGSDRGLQPSMVSWRSY